MNKTTAAKIQFYVELLLMVMSFLSALVLLWLLLLNIVPFGWGSGLALVAFLLLAAFLSPTEVRQISPVTGGNDDKPTE